MYTRGISNRHPRLNFLLAGIFAVTRQCFKIFNRNLLARGTQYLTSLRIHTIFYLNNSLGIYTSQQYYI